METVSANDNSSVVASIVGDNEEYLPSNDDYFWILRLLDAQLWMMIMIVPFRL